MLNVWPIYLYIYHKFRPFMSVKTPRYQPHWSSGYVLVEFFPKPHQRYHTASIIWVCFFRGIFPQGPRPQLHQSPKSRRSGGQVTFPGFEGDAWSHVQSHRQAYGHGTVNGKDPRCGFLPVGLFFKGTAVRLVLLKKKSRHQNNSPCKFDISRRFLQRWGRRAEL